jgi:hypothetical protein
MWWDDYSALVLLLVDVMLVVLMWLRFRYGGKHSFHAQATLTNAF